MALVDMLARSTRRFVCQSCRRRLRLPGSRAFSSAIENADLYDVVCVGGGPAGLSLLGALREQSCEHS